GADSPHLVANRVAYPLDERRVPGRAVGQRARERGRSPRHEPGEALLVDDGGDAEAGVLDEAALELVDDLRASRRVERPATERSGELAETVTDDLVGRAVVGERDQRRAVGRQLAGVRVDQA